MAKHGGARVGAGRKSDAEVRRLGDLLNANINRKQWDDLIRSIYRAAHEGNLRAAQLLLRYRYGDPDKAAAGEDPRYLSVIHFIDPSDPDSKPWQVPPTPEDTDRNGVQPATRGPRPNEKDR